MNVIKSLIISSFLIFLYGNINAQFTHPAVIVKHDSTKVACFARFPAKKNAKTIEFKTEKDGKFQKMKSSEIMTIRYFLNEDEYVEKEYIPYLRAHDVISGREKYSDPVWMDVIERGKITLFLNAVKDKSSRWRKYKYNYFYCRKENEVAIEMAITGDKHILHAYAVDYFAGSPTISEKIKRCKEMVCSVSADAFITMVEIYNSGE